MKITAPRESLLNGLQAVQSVVASRSSLPILSNVLISAEQGHIELRATDLEVSVICRVEANLERIGATTLPVKRLFGLIRDMQGGEVTLEVNDKEVSTLQAGASLYKINGIAGEEFPRLPQFKEEPALKITQSKLKEMIRKTHFAASTEESRHVLNGVYFNVQEDKLTMVATDGRRLALTEEEAGEGKSTKVEFIIPSKSIGELSRNLIGTGEVEMRLNKGGTDGAPQQVEFRIHSEGKTPVRICSKLIEGNFPNFKQVIPKEMKERVVIVREELLQALKRADNITSERNSSVKLSFTKNRLSITANSPDVGEGRENIALNYKGAEITIAFNPGYLMDPLKVLESDEINIELIDDNSPAVIKSNTPFLYVLMPMRSN